MKIYLIPLIIIVIAFLAGNLASDFIKISVETPYWLR